MVYEARLLVEHIVEIKLRGFTDKFRLSTEGLYVRLAPVTLLVGHGGRSMLLNILWEVSHGCVKKGPVVCPYPCTNTLRVVRSEIDLILPEHQHARFVFENQDLLLNELQDRLTYVYVDKVTLSTRCITDDIAQMLVLLRLAQIPAEELLRFARDLNVSLNVYPSFTKNVVEVLERVNEHLLAESLRYLGDYVPVSYSSYRGCYELEPEYRVDLLKYLLLAIACAATQCKLRQTTVIALENPEAIGKLSYTVDLLRALVKVVRHVVSETNHSSKCRSYLFVLVETDSPEVVQLIRQELPQECISVLAFEQGAIREIRPDIDLHEMPGIRDILNARRRLGLV